MIVQMRLENFKSFKDTGLIQLAPLTFLAGVNSAGKSSIIQALLLLKQTLESGSSMTLNLSRGNLIQQSLGERLDEFVFGQPPEEEASFSLDVFFEYRSDNNPQLFDDLKSILPNPPTNMDLRPMNNQISIKFSWGPFGSRGQKAVRVAEFQSLLKLDEEDILGLSIRPSPEGSYQVEPIRELIHPSLANLDFSRLRLDGLSNFLPDAFLIKYREQPSLYDIPNTFPNFYKTLFSEIREDLSTNLYYLNSFRKPPSRIYPAGQLGEERLLPDGSNFPSILWHLKDERVKYFSRMGLEDDFLNSMLMRVLNNVLEMPQEIEVKPVGDREEIFEVIVRTLGTSPIDVQLASVGLGYNQILPIILQGLITPPSSMVIFEQPEIHLHPEVQSRLVEFFIGLARSGRRVLVETHSSYMVDRLCLEIAKDRDFQLERNSKVLFVHPPDDEHNSSHIEEVVIDGYGVIQNYPPNFLPDTVGTYEQILKEGFVKRKDKTHKESHP